MSNVSALPRSNSAGFGIYLALGLLAAFSLFPIVLLLLNSLKSSTEILLSPLTLPKVLAWSNYSKAWADARFTQTFFNSLTVCVVTAIVVCVVSCLSGYVLARKKIASWKLLTGYLLAATTAPIQLYLFPLYFGYAKLGLINNTVGVAFIYSAIHSPFAIMLMRTYFERVPLELEEAALIDGASNWQTFAKVVLPLVLPGILTVALITALHTWNDFLIAATFLQKSENMTAVIAFFGLSGRYTSDWGEIMAAAVIVTLPIVILFLALQRYFIEGMAGGSVKG
jgi:raffinose/stachyose/melibiose transport system permease protein